MDVTDNKMVDEFYQYINDMAYYCGVLDYIKSDKDRQVTFRNETTLYFVKNFSSRSFSCSKPS